MTILLPILIIGIIGLVSGVGLAVAAILMAVPVNKTQQDVLEVLPGANCGGCGYSGCEGYAKAIAENDAAINLCAPGGSVVANKIAEITGKSAGGVGRQVACVLCSGNVHSTTKKYEYRGISTCAAASKIFKGNKSCDEGCLGFGDCVASCQFGAISIIDGISVIDANKCKSCGMCVKACPKSLIVLIGENTPLVVRCSNHNKGVIVRNACTAGCIACGRCEKVCPTGAIKVTDNLARIDDSKCTACLACVQACPTKVIRTRKCGVGEPGQEVS